MSVIRGEGRVPILYGMHAMAAPPHRSGYLARPDAADRHPGVVITAGADPAPSTRTLARHLARHGYAAVVPPGAIADLAAAVDALGGAWGEWSRADRRAVIGVGSGVDWATDLASRLRLPLVLLSPATPPQNLPEGVPVLMVTAGNVGDPVGIPSPRGRRVVYRGLGPGFWDDTSDDYSAVAAADCHLRIIGFLDRHLGVVAVA